MSQAKSTRVRHRTPPNQPARPGWYPDPDPHHEGQFRWWDGSAWTDWLSDNENAPMPRAVRRRLEPKPGLAEPRGIGGFITGLIAVVVVISLGALSFYGLRHPQETSGNEPMPTAFHTPAPAIKKWEQSRSSVIIKGVVQAEMPAGGRVLPSSGKLNGLFAQFAHWEMPISDHVATYLVIADLDPALVRPDPHDTGRAMLAETHKKYKKPEKITISNEVFEPHPTISGAVQVKARYNWAEAEDGASYDDVWMVIVPYQSPAGDGQAMWFTSLPSTAPEQQRLGVQDAFERLRRK